MTFIFQKNKNVDSSVNVVTRQQDGRMCVFDSRQDKSLLLSLHSVHTDVAPHPSAVHTFSKHPGPRRVTRNELHATHTHKQTLP